MTATARPRAAKTGQDTTLEIMDLLDREFDLGHPTVRAAISHPIRNLEVGGLPEGDVLGWERQI